MSALEVSRSKSQASLSRNHWHILMMIQFVAIVLISSQDIPNIARAHTGDLWLYYHDSGQWLQGKMPYRDFPLEYPPLALAAFALPRLAFLGTPISFHTYLWAFLIQSAILSSCLASWLRGMMAKTRFSLTRDEGLCVYCSLVILTSLYLPWRYDLFPALLTALAVGALCGDKPFRAGLWLGLGTAAKLYPMALLPLFFLYQTVRERRKSALWLTFGFVASLGICLLPLCTLPAPILLSFLKYHQMRGLEVESVPAGFLMLMHLYGAIPASVVVNYGADHLASPLAKPIIRCLPALFCLFYGAALWKSCVAFRSDKARTGDVQATTLIVSVISALLAFILANKVFSPQYLIWLIPFVPLLHKRLIVALASIFFLTTIDFPFAFNQLCSLQPGAIWLINIRNGLALALLGYLLLETQKPRQNLEKYFDSR